MSRSGENERFRKKYELLPPFQFNCIPCCWNYLVSTRGYRSKRTDEKLGVKFGGEMDTCVYLDAPENNVNGVVKTDKTDKEGTPLKRTVHHSVSYQLYTPPTMTKPEVLAIGKPVNARIESILAKKIQDAKILDGCCTTYSDAALLEFYREKIEKDSLKGTCCYPGREKMESICTELIKQNYTNLTMPQNHYCHNIITFNTPIFVRS